MTLNQLIKLSKVMEMFSFLSNTIKRYRDVENFSVKEFVLI